MAVWVRSAAILVDTGRKQKLTLEKGLVRDGGPPRIGGLREEEELVGGGHRRTDLARQAHGLQRRGYHLHGAGALAGVRRLRLEQFGVGEDDPELVVEPMNEGPKLVLTML